MKTVKFYSWGGGGANRVNGSRQLAQLKLQRGFVATVSDPGLIADVESRNSNSMYFFSLTVKRRVCTCAPSQAQPHPF